MNRSRTLMAGIPVLVVLLLLPQFVGTFWISNIIQILVFGLLALSAAFLLGHTGMLPLGQAAFFAGGAYATAYLQVILGQGFIVSTLAGLTFPILLGVLFSFAVRTRDVYFLLVTLAQGMVVWALALRWTSVTRGENGIGGVALPRINGINYAALSNYYYVVVAVVAVAVAGYFILINSPFGLTLRGIRDSETRMRALGYNVVLHKFAAFVLAAFIAGVAGVLYVYWNNFVSPPTGNLLRSAEAKLAAIMGGPATIFGAWFGAGVIVLIRNVLSAEMARYVTVMGVMFMAVALFFPKGVVAWNPQPSITLRGRRSTTGADADAGDATSGELAPSDVAHRREQTEDGR